MPNRILKDGLRTSGPVNSLTDRGFRLYANLLLCADDFGLLDWCYSWVKGQALPLQNWTEEEVLAAMDQVVSAALVRSYTANLRAYAAIEKWEQRRNANKPKFPMPPWGTDHIIGGYVAPRARDQVEKPKSRGNGANKSPDASPVVERLPLIGGKEYEVRQSLVDQLAPVYPKVDVPATIREMRGWCLGNTGKLKTAAGIKRFITTWLAREQEKYASQGSAGSSDRIICPKCNQDTNGEWTMYASERICNPCWYKIYG